jgi:sugar lactone lactonase YvrE
MVTQPSFGTRPSSTTIAGVLALLTALLALSLALAPRAVAYIYWTNNSGTIGRANLDGTGVDPRFIRFSVEVDQPNARVGDVAVDAKHVYWATGRAKTGKIGRARLDGTGVDERFITGVSFPTGVAVDAHYVYWVNTGTATIGRARLDGTEVDQSFITGVSFATSLAVDADYLYWAENNTSYPYSPTRLVRANLDGTGVDRRFIDSVDANGLAVDASYIYWADFFHAIGRANRDGTGVDPGFITGVGGYHAAPWLDVAVDNAHIYWSMWDVAADVGTIGRANLDGSNADVNFIEPSGELYGPEGIVVNGLTDTRAPKTKIIKGAPKKTDKHKVSFKFTSSEPNSTFECKLDKGKWRPCESPKKVKHVREGKHKFKVRAIDPAGNVDPTPAKDKFKVVG